MSRLEIEIAKAQAGMESADQRPPPPSDYSSRLGPSCAPSANATTSASPNFTNSSPS